MLDFSWSELLVVILVAVIAIGPKQLPEVLYGLGKIVRRLQYMRYALTRQFDDFMDQTDLKDIRNSARIVPAELLTSVTDEAEADEEAVMLAKPLEKTDDSKSQS